jgi:hypothetical protein
VLLALCEEHLQHSTLILQAHKLLWGTSPASCPHTASTQTSVRNISSTPPSYCKHTNFCEEHLQHPALILQALSGTSPASCPHAAGTQTSVRNISSTPPSYCKCTNLSALYHVLVVTTLIRTCYKICNDCYPV